MEPLALFVRLFTGSHLLATDFGVKPSSDPYVMFQHGANVVRSSVKKKTLYPVWNEVYKMNLSPAGPQEPLKVICMDQDPMTEDDHLGSAVVNLSGLRIGYEHIVLLRLHGGDIGSNVQAALQQHGHAAGKVAAQQSVQAAAEQHLGSGAGGLVGSLFSFAHDAKIALQQTSKPPPPSAQDLAQSQQLGEQLSGGLLGEAKKNKGVICAGFVLIPVRDMQLYRGPPPPMPVAPLTVRLIAGANLIAADMGTVPKSDPYCVLSLNGETYQSNVVKDTTSPEWQQIFGFRSAMGPFTVTCFDKDTVGSDDNIGGAMIDLGVLRLQPGMETVVTLCLEGGEHGENVGKLAEQQATPLGQAVAGQAVSQYVGGPAGSMINQFMKPSKEDFGKVKNKGVIALSFSLPPMQQQQMPPQHAPPQQAPPQ